ncbi:MAG TPA: hypothetical protein VIK37_01210 [Candidatus Saccharimonadales bacterium]
MSISTANFLGRYAILPKKPGLRVKKDQDLVFTSAETESEKLINITDGARDNLITANTVFPFVLFTDTVSIDRQKLTIVHRSFFRTSSTISVQIDDVQIAKVDVGPFFGSVHLASKYFVDNIQSINFLKRADAIRIQRLLQGYMIAHHRKIDCASIDNDQLVVLLNDLGQSSTN